MYKLVLTALVLVVLAGMMVDAQHRDETKDFDTLSDASNKNPTGIWSDGTTMWVADSFDSKIYAYRMSDKARDAAKEFDTLNDAGNSFPFGIWSDGTTMWVVDAHDEKIYAYRMSDKARDAAKDFDTLSDAGNDDPNDIWSDGTTMWVADNNSIYAYRMSDKARDAAKEFDTLTSGNNLPVGIWSDGTTMWVADTSVDKIYAYRMSDKARDAAKDVDTLNDAGNNSPLGIWSDGTTMWVLDVSAKIYAYVLPTASHQTSQTPPQNPSPQNPSPQNPSPQNPSPQNPSPQNPSPQNPSPHPTTSSSGSGSSSSGSSSSGSFFFIPVVRDTTPPTITMIDVENDTKTLGETLTFNITFSEPVSGVDAGDFVLMSGNQTIPITNHTSINATIHPEQVVPHGSMADFNIEVEADGIVNEGIVWFDTEYSKSPFLKVWLTSPDCRTVLLHNQTFPLHSDMIKPRTLELAGSPAGGIWTLSIQNFARTQNATVHSFGLTLDVGQTIIVDGIGSDRMITINAATTGNLTLGLVDDHDIVDVAGNRLAGEIPTNPYTVIEPPKQTCP